MRLADRDERCNLGRRISNKLTDRNLNTPPPLTATVVRPLIAPFGPFAPFEDNGRRVVARRYAYARTGNHCVSSVSHLVLSHSIVVRIGLIDE